MAVLLVTYDLDKPGQNYKDILEAIKSYPWARLSESSYAIRTNQSPQDMFGRLKAFLDGNDSLYVVTMKKPYAGYGPKEVIEWLDGYLEY